MASKEGEVAPAENVQQPAEAAPVEAPPAEAPAAEATPAEAPAQAEASATPPKRQPLSPEEVAKRKAERAEKRKEQRKLARQAAKEAKARGEAPKPKAGKADKAAKTTEVQAPENGVPKISVAKLPTDITIGELKDIFAPYGTILRADVLKRRGRPTLGTIIYNTHGEVRRAVAALNGKHKCNGAEDAISIQYAKDSAALGELLKKTTDSVADCIREYSYKPGVLRSRDAKDLLNRMVLGKKKPLATELLTAALLVQTKAASAEEVVNAKMASSANQVTQLLKEEKAEVAAPKTQNNTRAVPKSSKEEVKPSIKLEKTFDAVVPHLDKLEKERWNRMAKANLRLNERHRFRFVDILATPSLELWRWMVEDCEITPAEAGTCFAILQNYYGFTK